MAAACSGGGTPQPEGPAKAAAPVDTAPSAPVLTGVRLRLQGTWEIVRYQSDYPVPSEAMPLMAEMFDSLRLRFEPDQALVRTEKTPEERMDVTIEAEDGDAFKLNTHGNMFDGAACRFLGPDEWEVTDRGKTWPGVSILRRAKPEGAAKPEGPRKNEGPRKPDKPGKR